MAKKLTPDELLREDRKRKLKEKLTEEKRKVQERKTIMRAAKSGLPYIDLKTFPVDKEAVVFVPKKLAEEVKVVCFMIKDSEVRVGVVDPERPGIKKVTEFLTNKGYKLSLYVISEQSFEHVLDIYGQVKIIKTRKEEIKIKKERIKQASEQIETLEDLKGVIKRVPVTDMVDYILAGALGVDASDVHMEPVKERVEMRYRIDGVLQDVLSLPFDVYEKILSRIKLLSGLKINIIDKPQDGRFSISLDGRELDLRVSVLPTSFGETLVMRLLGVGAVDLDLDKLGLRKRELDLLDRVIKKPLGLILTCGPTGSGKTTTLYACLNKVKDPTKKVITLENPVEYRLPGISQTEVNPEKGLSFVDALRSVLRQDPDVVMVGEIRDRETAGVAAQAALTGHLVLSTLHANDAAGAIPRLISMGARSEEIAPALKLIMAQRLARKLCEECKEEYAPSEEEIKELKEKLGKFYPESGVEKLYKAKGCEVCNGIGYKGRVGIYEMFEIGRKIEELIGERVSNLEIEKVAIEQGMMLMGQDGLLKVVEGVTSLEEIERVI